MRPIIAVTLILIAVPAAAMGDVLLRAENIIRTHKLLTPKELACSTLVEGTAANPRLAEVTVLEHHSRRCGGDPDTAPRRFDLDTNLKTGAATWDNNDDMEQRRIP
jgi:hypothetical protein